MSDCECHSSGLRECDTLRMRCLARDGIACEALARKFTPLIFAIVRRVLGPQFREECEDVKQEVLLKLFNRLELSQESGPFCVWLKTLAVNRAIDARRKLKRREPPGLILSDIAEPRSEAHLSRETRECIERVYERLPEEWRLVFDLTLQDMDRQEVAKRVGVSLRSVQYWLKEIRVRLRPCLET